MSADSKDRCGVCDRNIASRNNHTWECAAVGCPHRRRAWSERPQPEERKHHAWGLTKSKDPEPLDRVVKKGGVQDA